MLHPHSFPRLGLRASAGTSHDNPVQQSGSTTWSVVISARPPSPGRATTRMGFPGSFAERGTRSQFSPASVVCSRMAGLPQIQPSCR